MGVPVFTKEHFQEEADHRGAYQRTGFRVYRSIDGARLVGKMQSAPLELTMQVTVPNMDARRPPAPLPKPPWPVVVLAHGGGWVGGGPGSPSQQKLAQDLATSGVICVCVAYRHTPRLNGPVWKRRDRVPFKQIREARQFPAAVRDLKAAVRRARLEMTEGLLKNVTDDQDPPRVGVCGTSAGAHLVSLVALTEGELDDVGEERATNTRQPEWIPRPRRPTRSALRQRRARITESLVDLGDLAAHSNKPDFVAPIACPHPDLAKQLLVGRTRKRLEKRTPGVFSLTENGDEDLVRDASPATYLGGARELPEFLFFHAQNDKVSPFEGVDSEAKDDLKLPKRYTDLLKMFLKDNDFEDLGPGFRQLLEGATSGSGAISKLWRLEHVKHRGWKRKGKRVAIARAIEVLARRSLDAVDVPAAPAQLAGALR